MPFAALLIRQQPDSLSVRIPCSLAPEPRAAEQPTTVVATARTSETAGGLRVTRAGDLLTVRVGAEVLAELKAPTSATTVGWWIVAPVVWDDGSPTPPQVVVYEIGRRIPGAKAVALDSVTDGS